MGAPIAATLVMLLDRRRLRGACSLLLLLPHNNCVVETWRKLVSLGVQRGPKGGRSGAPVSGVASVIAY